MDADFPGVDTESGKFGHGLLLRHASQNSLDESSQINPANFPEEDEFKAPYKNSAHFERAFMSIDALRRNKVFCDVKLLADDVEIPAHRLVLASCSPYFNVMFTSFEEKDKDCVRIQGVDGIALQMLINYVYTGQINITEDTVQTLLPTANLLQLSDVKEACSEFLKAQLHPSNCLGIRTFADIHGCADLVTAADSFIQFHFPDVVEGEEFLALSVNQVANLIASDRIVIPTEEKVFECVLNWVNHDREGRQADVPLLMEQVRLPLLPQEFLTRVDEEPLLRNPKCKDLLIEALKFHLLRPEQRASFTSPRTKQRMPVGLPKVLIVVGGQAPKAIRCVEVYDFKDERWRLLGDTPTRRCRAGLAYVQNKLYAVGGFNGSLRVKACEVFDPKTAQWIASPPMNARRSTLGVAVLNSMIYAVGGFDGSTGLNTAEVFNPEKNEWLPIACLSTRRSSVGVGVVAGKLYAVGGYDGQSRNCLNTVECYNPELNSWSSVPDMQFRRSGAGVGILDSQLYVVGGHDGPIVRKSCEVFDVSTNTWKPISDMSTCRRNAGVVALNGELIVVGGDDGNCNLSSVEVYNPHTDTWKFLNSSMVVARSYAGVAIIDKPVGYT